MKKNLGKDKEPKSKVKTIGRLGEEVAVDFLKNKGYRIIERNFRWRRWGEIDIIARDRNYLVFVEVKTRGSESFGKPKEAVDKYKQFKLQNLAKVYLLKNRLKEINCRFDVISIFINAEGKVEKIELIKNAFWAKG